MPCLANNPCSCAAHKLSMLLLADAAPMLMRNGVAAAHRSNGEYSSKTNSEIDRTILTVQHPPD